MFSNQFKVSRKAPGRIYVLPAIAMALLLVVTAVFLFSSAKAQTPAGDFCVEGIVIDWEEEPMGGITVTLETALGATIAKQTKTNEDDEGEFKFDPFDSNPNGWAAVPGYYTATVTLPGPYWKGVSPETAYNPPTPENPQLVFRLESGMDDCAQIRFKLAEIVEVYAWKMDSNHVPLPGWTIDATPGPGNIFAEPQDQNTTLDTTLSQTGTVKPAVFELTPGNWIFSERQPEPEGDHVRPDPFAPIVPIGGKQMLDVQPINYEVDPPYIIVFKNEFHNNGCVIARKYGMLEEAAPPEIDPVEANQLLDYGADAQVPMTTIPGLFDSQGDPAGAGVYGAGGWGFALLAMDGTVVRKGVTDAEGIITFEGLPYGPYTIKEEDRPGWDEWTPRYVDVNLIDGTCQVVEFYNMQDDSGFCIEGYKLDANGGYGLAGWFIDVDPLDAGGFDPADPAERGDFYADDPYFNESKEKFVTDGVGMYKIGFPDNDYRIPGSRYEICEDDSVDGWLPHTPTCQVVELPKWPGACVQAKDFVNQQVGHAEKAKYEEMQDNPQTMDRVAPMGPTGPGGPGEKGVYCKNSHTVQAGEGLFTIAADYNVSPQAMVDANPEVRDSPNWWVYEGQNLCIP